MGLIIGQSALNFSNSGRGGVGDFAREATATKVREATLSLPSGGETPKLGERRAEAVEQTRAVNAPGAALRTIDRGVASARRIVPDVKDILDIARERFTESRARRLEQLQEQQSQQQEAVGLTRLLPSASVQVGRFFQSSQSAGDSPTPARVESFFASRETTRTGGNAQPALLDVFA